jgi:hypothetical protein
VCETSAEGNHAKWGGGDFMNVILPYFTLECAPRYSVDVLKRLRVVFTENFRWGPGCFKANSQSMPCLCRVALIHTCHAAPLPYYDSAVSFVKIRVVAGNIRTASQTV